jgi:hypothetical protein
MRRYVDDYGIGPWEVYEFDGDLAVVIKIFTARPQAVAQTRASPEARTLPRTRPDRRRR